MQTSIEWFNEKISELDVEFHYLLITKEQYWIKRNKLLEQAREMHNREMVRNTNQLKISNKEIESAANEHNRMGYFISPYSFAEGAKWYRKKLKRK